MANFSTMKIPDTHLLEVWQRGPIKDIPPLLQPVAHALLQAREEVNLLMINFPNNLLWVKPVGLASPAFHLQHLAGVLDRVFTYARSEKLNDVQLTQLQAEDDLFIPGLTVTKLLDRFNMQVDIALQQLKTTDEQMLTEIRWVGRQLIPSTMIGLLIHAAEHTMRHLGQLIVTVKIITSSKY